jgi:hypothetical protein
MAGQAGSGGIGMLSLNFDIYFLYKKWCVANGDTITKSTMNSLKLRMVTKSLKRDNIGWDATSRDEKYLGRKIH